MMHGQTQIKHKGVYIISVKLNNTSSPRIIPHPPQKIVYRLFFISLLKIYVIKLKEQGTIPWGINIKPLSHYSI